MLKTNPNCNGCGRRVCCRLARCRHCSGHGRSGRRRGTKTITCTKASGNVNTTVKLAGCNGNTGTKSKKFNATTLESGGTIKWKSGKTTSFAAPTLGTGVNCPVGDTDVTATGVVTADTTGSAKPIPGTYQGEVCVDGSGNVSLPPGHPLTAN